MIDYKLLQGDCLELMKDIPDKSIDMILCDLPFAVTQCKWDVLLPMEPLWKIYRRVIKPNVAICLFAIQPFTSILIMSNSKMFKYEWIWEKAKAAGHLNARRRPLNAHETIIVFSNSTPKYFPQLTSGKPYKNNHKPGDAGDCYGEVNNYSFDNKGTRFPRSVQKFSNEFKPIHPTQKPVPLCEYLIKTYTNEGDTVLDNCFGSCSTGIACMRTNRNFIGIEKDEKYFQLGKNRMENESSLIEA